jgi:endonuclease III
MKDGTFYAAQLKKLYAKLCPSAPPPSIPEPDEPLMRLVIAILGMGCSDAEAERAINQALTVMVDLNEIRVSGAYELHKAMGNAIPQGAQRCQCLIDALQAIYSRENRLSLERLKELGRREARHCLEQLKGVDEYAAACVSLWSLGGHAIPVNDRLLQALRDEKVVNPSSDRAEVQAFLERHVSAADAKAFCLIMRSFAETSRQASKKGRTGAAAKAVGGAQPEE